MEPIEYSVQRSEENTDFCAVSLDLEGLLLVLCIFREPGPCYLCQVAQHTRAIWWGAWNIHWPTKILWAVSLDLEGIYCSNLKQGISMCNHTRFCQLVFTQLCLLFVCSPNSVIWTCFLFDTLASLKLTNHCRNRLLALWYTNKLSEKFVWPNSQAQKHKTKTYLQKHKLRDESVFYISQTTTDIVWGFS